MQRFTLLFEADAETEEEARLGWSSRGIVGHNYMSEAKISSLGFVHQGNILREYPELPIGYHLSVHRSVGDDKFGFLSLEIDYYAVPDSYDWVSDRRKIPPPSGTFKLEKNTWVLISPNQTQ